MKTETEGKAEHTALPWKITGNLNSIENANGLIVCNCNSNSEDADADAAFICKAVNAHEELVEAIKALRETILNGEERELRADEQEALIRSRNAIGKAEAQ